MIDEQQGMTMFFSLQPDPHMEWIYDPKYRDDPRARDLRERREAAIRSAPKWMIDAAIANDERNPVLKRIAG